MKKAFTFLTIIIAACVFVGCGSDNKSQEVKRITMEDVESVSDEQLANEVIQYVKEHPESRIDMENFILNNKTLHDAVQFNVKSQDGKIGAEAVLDTVIPVPVIGGLIGSVIDSQSDKHFLELYKKQILAYTNDYTVAKDVTDRLLASRQIDQETHDKFLSIYVKEDIDTETYNAMVKIGALMFRETKAVVDDIKRADTIFPSTADIAVGLVVELASYVMSDDENKKKRESARQALDSIYNDFSITDNSKLENLWEPLVPKYILPYRLKAVVEPKDYKFKNDDQAILALYPYINGKWESLYTKEIFEIWLNPAHLNRVHYNDQPANIAFIDPDIPLASFQFSGKNVRYFITPVIYTDEEGKEEEVLFLYKSYNFVNFNGVWEGVKYADNLCVDNIRYAGTEDVFIKRKNEQGNFKTTFDPQRAFQLSVKKYYLSDKLEPIYFPDYEQDLDYDCTDNVAYQKRINALLKKEWKSIKTGERKLNGIKWIQSLSFINKNESEPMFARMSVIRDDGTKKNYFDGNPTNVFITPALYKENGTTRQVLVMYLGFTFVQYSQEERGAILAEDCRVDNIYGAQDVLYLNLE